MEDTINLKDLFKILKKRWYLIALMSILAITISGVLSYFVFTPIYQSSTQILVNQKNRDNVQLNTDTINTDLQLINTYSVIIKSPAILNKVIDQLDLKTTANSLTNQISVNSEQESQVINLSVQDTDPNKAMNIANTITEVFENEIKKMMEVNNVKIITPATSEEVPIKPKPILNMAIATVIGLMIGIGLTILLEYFDNSIKTEQDIEEVLGVPILGLISPFSQVKVSPNIRSRRKRV